MDEKRAAWFKKVEHLKKHHRKAFDLLCEAFREARAIGLVEKQKR